MDAHIGEWDGVVTAGAGSKSSGAGSKRKQKDDDGDKGKKSDAENGSKKKFSPEDYIGLFFVLCPQLSSFAF